MSMFEVSTHWFKGAIIEGCPKSRLAAVDFRRAAGLPEAPSNQIEIADLRVTSEPLFRELAERLPIGATGGAEWYCHMQVRRTANDFRSVGYGKEYCADYVPVLPASEIIALIARDHQAWVRLLVAWNAECLRLVAAYHQEQEQREQAAAEQRRIDAEREAQMAAARELLARELQDGQTAEKNLQIVAKFLASVPGDAKRGTLRSLTASAPNEAIAELRARVENASPVVIFDDDDEDDDDDDDEDEDES